MSTAREALRWTLIALIGALGLYVIFAGGWAILSTRVDWMLRMVLILWVAMLGSPLIVSAYLLARRRYRELAQWLGVLGGVVIFLVLQTTLGSLSREILRTPVGHSLSLFDVVARVGWGIFCLVFPFLAARWCVRKSLNLVERRWFPAKDIQTDSPAG